MQWRIGDVTVTKIVELEVTGGSRFILPQATRKAIRPIAWLRPHFADEDGRLRMSIHSFVVQPPGRRIIVDTCLGNDKQNRRIPTWNNLHGSFLAGRSGGDRCAHMRRSRLVPTIGHTPGYVSVRSRSGGEEALITGDFMHHPVKSRIRSGHLLRIPTRDGHPDASECSPRGSTATHCKARCRLARRATLSTAFRAIDADRAYRSVAELAWLWGMTPVVTAFTIDFDTPDRMAEMAAAKRTRPLLRLEFLGGGAVERVRAARHAAPAVRLIVDANETWNEARLGEFIPALVDARVLLIEQPVPADADDALARLQLPIPICADESCRARADLDRLNGKYAAINVELDKAGWLTEVLALAAAAKRRACGGACRPELRRTDRGAPQTPCGRPMLDAVPSMLGYGLCRRRGDHERSR